MVMEKWEGRRSLPFQKGCMQRLAGNFIIKRSVVSYGADGNMVELYELPNGQWQFGKGRDATVVTSMEQISVVTDPAVRKDIEAWIERSKGQPLQAVQQGATPLLEGETVRDRLSTALSRMPEEAVARILGSIEQVMGPIADSLSASAQTNHYSDGFGQDQAYLPPSAIPFMLPEGAKWAQEGRPESGYLTPDPTVRDEKGNVTMRWHPTPQFAEMVEAAPEKTAIEIEMDAEREKHQERELVGAGAGRRTRRR